MYTVNILINSSLVILTSGHFKSICSGTTLTYNLARCCRCQKKSKNKILLVHIYNDKTGQATIRMNRRAVLKRWWTSLQGESFTVLSTASLFSSIEASSVLFLSPFYEQKMPKYVLNLCVTWTANTEKILDFRIGPKIGPIQCSKGDKYLYLPHMSG